ncbi:MULTISPECIES: hypothetical protein [unclassified Mesorhizobium]|uniref:hypothetical protein n=1 Tax=unclassified Mesorhizobium TaxID=325217 RepID=UPI0019D12F45|nr:MULTISPECIES: hypothetical protein [unclassified Mesorhizobium]
MDAETQTGPAEPEQPFEWMMVEIFGHRSHWGRGIEVERFGAKMLRIDVPQVEWSTPSAEKPEPQLIVTGWVSHFYGGASIFSNTLTDEATVLRRCAPYRKPALYIAPPDEVPDDDFAPPLSHIEPPSEFDEEEPF